MKHCFNFFLTISLLIPKNALEAATLEIYEGVDFVLDEHDRAIVSAVEEFEEISQEDHQSWINKHTHLIPCKIRALFFLFRNLRDSYPKDSKSWQCFNKAFFFLVDSLTAHNEEEMQLKALISNLETQIDFYKEDSGEEMPVICSAIVVLIDPEMTSDNHMKSIAALKKLNDIQEQIDHSWIICLLEEKASKWRSF
jgi:hypothetical protein